MSYDAGHSNKENMTSCQHNVIHFKNKTMFFNFKQPSKQLSNMTSKMEVLIRTEGYKCLKVLHNKNYYIDKNLVGGSLLGG